MDTNKVRNLHCHGFFHLFKSSYVIRRKLTKDNSFGSAFRHINTRIVKTNSTFPLGQDMFSMIGSSKREEILVIDLKDAFHSLRSIILYLSSTSYLYQRMPMELNISQAI